jgi:hypothetical protein
VVHRWFGTGVTNAGHGDAHVAAGETRESFGDRGIPVINPALVALALVIAVLVALLVVVLLRRDPVDAAQGQSVTRTPVEQYSLVNVL